jgi:hypothetical protein
MLEIKPEKNSHFLRNPEQNRRAVFRFRAGQNVLITLLSFAFSVSATRLFLELTGYPQIGGGNLHIAHVLWGGVFLFVASLLSIIYANEWITSLSALIAGLGVGLFIDEVGKFITSNNDYFFPSAAPIVYAFFLLTLLVVFQVRLERPKPNRAKMYEVLERLTEVLDKDLSIYERDRMLRILTEILQNSENRELNELALALQNFLKLQLTDVEPLRPNFLDRLRFNLYKFENKYLTQFRQHWVIIISLLICGIWAFVSPLIFLNVSHNSLRLETLVTQLISQNLVSNMAGLSWFETKVVLEGCLGLFMVLAATLMICKKEKTGLWIAMFSLLLALTMVNLLVFYFEQFSTIVMATFQFLTLVLIVRYRKRFVKDH